MNISSVIGKNIKILMEKENVSLRKLSESIGITHPTLIKYVEGNQPIDSEKLMMIALYFKKPFDYFFKEDNKSINFMFRADKPEKDIQDIDLDNLRNSIYSYLDILGNSGYQYIPQKYNINLNDDKRSIFNLIAKIAYDQRRIANIENVIPDNYFDVIQNIGINVIAKDFKNDAYFGASSFSSELGSYIIINNSERIPEERKIFSLIHEYGHLLFHSDQYSNSQYNAFYINGKSDMNEKIANKFAGHFLMPKNLVDSYIESRKNIDPLEMKKHFKVSIQTLYVMLHEYGIISKETYADFWKQITIHGFKMEEPAPLEKIDIQEKNTKLVNKIKDLYFSEDISANKISEVLGIDTIETRKLLKEWRNIDERYLPLK
jgi:Zn-dependent peptidase ImmA (M78 family)